MDILYYSNYCKHSKALLETLVKNDLVKNLNCICVDKRRNNPQTGQTHIVLENGNAILLPPNVHSVPALLLVKENYQSVFGKKILMLFQDKIKTNTDEAFHGNGEPAGFSLGGGKDIHSEQFTFYNSTTEDLSAKGSGGIRPLYHYVPADGVTKSIETPPDRYTSVKIPENITPESIQETRTHEMKGSMNQNTFLPTNH